MFFPDFTAITAHEAGHVAMRYAKTGTLAARPAAQVAASAQGPPPVVRQRGMITFCARIR
jgi:hypothetical protein